MKVFLLMYYDYDDTNHYGIYASEEVASKVADQLVEDSKREYTRYGEVKVYYTKNRAYFSIEECEVMS